MSEFECRYLFDEKPNNISFDAKDLTYRKLSLKLKQSTNNTEKEALLYELKIREFDIMQARRKTYFDGNYPRPAPRPLDQPEKTGDSYFKPIPN